LASAGCSPMRIATIAVAAETTLITVSSASE
jgi:hypothetical protein